MNARDYILMAVEENLRGGLLQPLFSTPLKFIPNKNSEIAKNPVKYRDGFRVTAHAPLAYSSPPSHLTLHFKQIVQTQTGGGQLFLGRFASP